MIKTTFMEFKGIHIELRSYNDRNNTFLFRRVDANQRSMSGWEDFSEEALAMRVNGWANPTQGSLKGSIKI
jgi:hypothetical protein